MKTIDIAKGYDYASKWGLTDFYPDCLETLKKAIESDGDFQTEWFECKNEMRYARYTRASGNFRIEVSVHMDDLWEEADLIYDALDSVNISEDDIPDDFIDDIRDLAIFNDIDDHTKLESRLPYDATLEDIIAETESLEARCEMADEEMFNILCELVKSHMEYIRGSYMKQTREAEK